VQFDETRSERIVAAPVDVGEIVETLVTEVVVADTAVNYNPAKLDNETGVLTASSLDLSKFPLKKIFATLADMADADQGVDGDGDFFFTQRDGRQILRTLFVGRDMHDFKPSLNKDGIKNSIVVRRQEGKGSAEPAGLLLGFSTTPHRRLHGAFVN